MNVQWFTAPFCWCR